MSIFHLTLFISGLILLLLGAEWLVRGASGIASRFGLSSLVVGLTVVALGSSTPELAVSIYAAVGGQPDMATGNIIGSNIFNVLFVLGVAALITPLSVTGKLVRHDTPLMIGASILLWVLCADALLGRLDGAILSAALTGYMVFNLRRATDGDPRELSQEESSRPRGHSFALVILGVGLLVLGSRLLLTGATGIARSFGLSDLVIGLTIVAAATGLPEAATTLVAARRGERDMAIANVVGSNTMNILCVLGLTSLLSPQGVGVAPAAIRFDLPVMIAAAAVCLPIFFSGGRISRGEGALLVAAYAAYMAFVVLDATNHDALAPLSEVMLAFVLPLVILAIAVPAWQQWRLSRLQP